MRRRVSSAAREVAKTPTWAGRSSWSEELPSPKKVSTRRTPERVEISSKSEEANSYLRANASPIPAFSDN